MPFGRKAGDIRVYEYGCGALMPEEGLGAAVRAMRGRVDLWNTLVELDRSYDVKREELLSPFLAAQRAAGGSETVTVGAEAERAARKLPSVAWKALKADPMAKAALDALAAEETSTARGLARDSGLWWCNYEEVLLAWQQARFKPGKLQFHSWHQEVGKTTVRWQQGLAVADAFGEDTRMWIEPVPADAWSRPRGERRRLTETTLRLRVASDERLRPIWLALPIVLHRPLPVDGVIRSASALREHIGNRVRWKVVLVVDRPGGWATQDPSTRVGRVALDIGWRQVETGLRVAVWMDESGQADEVVLNGGWLRQLAKVDELQQQRDLDFNAVRPILVAFLKTAKTLPEWLSRVQTGLGQWHNPARLASLVAFWRDHRFTGDEEIFPRLADWRVRQERHHHEWQDNLRDQLLKSRREQYRCVAADLVRRYEEVVLEEFDLSHVARVKKRKGEEVEPEGKDLMAASRHQRFQAATSVLRLAIRSAAKREGVRVVEVPAQLTTLRCHVCGQVDDFDKAAELWHTCPQCGARWDQDYNAAANLLALAKEQGDGAG